MNVPAPTVDRLFAGLMAGAAVGALIVTITLTVYAMAVAAEPSINVWWFVSTVVLVFLLFGLTMPLAQAPLWFLLRTLRLRDWIAATIAGGLAFIVPIGLFSIAWADYVGSAPITETVASLVCCGGAGLAAGFVAWRVASSDI